jgi:hypothetical protein
LWGATGGIVAAVRALLSPQDLVRLYLSFVLISVLNWAITGAIGGAAFGLALPFFERKRAIEQLSLVRVAALGGLVPTLIFFILFFISSGELPVWSTALTVATLGAGCAAGSLALARRGRRVEQAHSS